MIQRLQPMVNDVHRSRSMKLNLDPLQSEENPNNEVQARRAALDDNNNTLDNSVSSQQQRQPKQPLPPILHQQVTPPPQATFRVLLVDDSPINRKLLGKLLKSVGHVCDEADDGDVAVAKVTPQRSLLNFSL